MYIRVASFIALLVVQAVSAQDFLPGVKKVVFLGDSITYAGQYVVFFETEWRLREPKRDFEVLNVGLPSETVSGLSEAGHAAGKFPRPGLHERLGRVLDKMKPDLVFACYGMNDGIYLPLAEDRFQKHKDGLIRLREDVMKAGAKIIHMTPAVFDPNPIRARLASADKADSNHPYEKYDEVLDAYSEWLLRQRENGWQVIDLHFAMKKELEARRKSSPKFTFAGDGVHPNLAGQLVMGRSLWAGLAPKRNDPDAAWGSLDDSKSKRSKLFQLVQRRSQLLRDAWLSHTGHKRPLSPGLPLDQAQSKAAEITRQIEKLLAE